MDPKQAPVVAKVLLKKGYDIERTPRPGSRAHHPGPERLRRAHDGAEALGHRGMKQRVGGAQPGERLVAGQRAHEDRARSPGARELLETPPLRPVADHDERVELLAS